MNSQVQQPIEETLGTFAEKYQDLLTDIQKGLERLDASFGHQKQLQEIQQILAAMEKEEFSKAAELLKASSLEELFKKDFLEHLFLDSRHIKLHTDINTLRSRFINLGLREADASHYL